MSHSPDSDLSLPVHAPMAEAHRQQFPLRVIRGHEDGPAGFDLRELWAYRELMLMLCWRDLKLRYSETMLGFGWTILQPLLSTGIFSLLFGKLAKLPSDGVPYPVFSFLALLPWTLFVNGVTRASYSLSGNAYLVTKIYFPRLVLPLGSMLPSLVDLGVSLFAAAGILAWYGIMPSWWSPFAVLLIIAITFVLTFGLGLIVTALYVRFRDIGNLIPFLINIGLWVAPITYPLSIVPEQYRFYMKLNPMTGLIEGFRNAMLGRPLDLTLVAYSAGFALVASIIGLRHFRKVESTFADII